LFTAGITYTGSAPAYNPGATGSRVAIDTTTFDVYLHKSGTTWERAGRGIDEVTGCVKPTYTPSKFDANVAISMTCDSIWRYRSGVWYCANCPQPPVTYTAGTGIDITGATITNTGDLSSTNELQTLSSGTNTVTLSNSGGTVTVDTDPTNDITSLSGGTGISVSGSGNSRAITNTGDLSNTNELQTLSISNDTLSISDGNSVVLPGGVVTWPLLAPTGFNPQYSFEGYPGTGMFSPDGGIYLYTQNADSANNVIGIYAGSGTDNDGGQFEMGSGGSVNGNGGYFLLTAGNSTVSDGGRFIMNAGDSSEGAGGEYNIRSGNGNAGGNLYISSGNGIVKSGGDFFMNAGSSNYDDGGNFSIAAGSSVNSNGGSLALTAGNGAFGGELNISAGYSSVSGYSNVTIIGGTGLDPNTRGNIRVEYAIEYTPITQAVRDSNTPVSGKTVFCSNCTANDGSTGVLQTYNGSTWKNHW
jgi:hypothetical protein